MGKPFSLTKERMDEAVDKFKQAISGMYGYSKVTTYKVEFPKVEKEAILRFEWEAYLKMHALIAEFGSEVGWHGTVLKSVEDGTPVYTVKDILVYPQQVTGATTTTDQKEYEDWLYGLDDETFENVRFHGHSHVNMSTTPSPTDMDHRAGILSEFRDDDFYIFVIWNKKDERNITIYDAGENLIFEDQDVMLEIDGEMATMLSDYVAESRKSVSKMTYVQKNTNTGIIASKGVDVYPAHPTPEQKNTSHHTAKYEDDYEDEYYSRYRDPKYDPEYDDDDFKNPYGAFGWWDGGSYYD